MDNNIVGKLIFFLFLEFFNVYLIVDGKHDAVYNFLTNHLFEEQCKPLHSCILVTELEATQQLVLFSLLLNCQFFKLLPFTSTWNDFHFLSLETRNKFQTCTISRFFEWEFICVITFAILRAMIGSRTWQVADV